MCTFVGFIRVWIIRPSGRPLAAPEPFSMGTARPRMDEVVGLSLVAYAHRDLVHTCAGDWFTSVDSLVSHNHRKRAVGPRSKAGSRCVVVLKSSGHTHSGVEALSVFDRLSPRWSRSKRLLFERATLGQSPAIPYASKGGRLGTCLREVPILEGKVAGDASRPSRAGGDVVVAWKPIRDRQGTHAPGRRMSIVTLKAGRDSVRCLTATAEPGSKASSVDLVAADWAKR
jgi:hypothetical protein